jgi:hypothetical protein
MTRLDQMIEHARAATVDRDAAERYVRELDRWARPAVPAPLWRWLMLGAGAGLAAAAIALVVIGWPRATDDDLAPVRVGPQVAVVADADSLYHVVRTDHDATVVEIERGAVTARLWPGAHHRLTLAGLGVTANAVGTVYSLAIRTGHPVVHVVEGTVEVRADDGVHLVHAAETWPQDGAPANPAAGTLLLQLTAPPPDAAIATTDEPPAPPPLDAGVIVDAPPAHVAPPAIPVKERWRQARLLRGLGMVADARPLGVAIGDARDPVWSPIALVEAVRIALGPLAAPERAIELADRMLRAWPKDPLAGEARSLRCRALSQLGRPCDPP